MTDLAAYKRSREFKTWARANTFNGYTWFPERSEAQKNASREAARKSNTARSEKAERLFENVDWLIRMGEHPLLIAQEVGFKPVSFAKWCRRNGHEDVARMFEEKKEAM
ncbi:hypothetical protein [Gryllotalpicola koreensis]|uniref:Helix-turn-helix domain-containing protein n=1 Tax=Gryllotalpicola koreensis TaxID=993086 RepID=A0ABP8A289_9MICO